MERESDQPRRKVAAIAQELPIPAQEQLYIHCSGQETRVALAHGDRLAELQVERTAGRGLSGNIYRGRISRVIPSMDAAFVDIGLEKMALLHASDVWLPGVQEMLSQPDADGQVPKRIHKSISQLLQQGQQVMVQVVREPVAKKGPRVTMYISLPGRNVVLLTRDPQHGVSKMIADAGERERLLAIVSACAPAGCGAIVRTVGDGATQAELQEDLRLLRELWQDILARYDAATGPSFIYDDLDLVLRALRDMVSSQTTAVWIDDPNEISRIETFVKRFHPEARPLVCLHQAATSLFEAHGLEGQIRDATEPRVRLKSGGELVISRTEAMTVIDVNSSRQVGQESLGQALLALNLEAALAVAQQLRLRNIGGLVVVDFVDMARAEDRRTLEAMFEGELAHDRARVRVGKINEFGTVQLTRKRVRESIYDRLTETCPTCKGRGYVRSSADLAIEAIGRLRTAIAADQGQTPIFRVQVPARVAAILNDQLAGALRDLERQYRVQIEVTDHAKLVPGSADVRVVIGEERAARWRLGRPLAEIPSEE